jgi:hypothetical protein
MRLLRAAGPEYHSSEKRGKEASRRRNIVNHVVYICTNGGFLLAFHLHIKPATKSLFSSTLVHIQL